MIDNSSKQYMDSLVLDVDNFTLSLTTQKKEVMYGIDKIIKNNDFSLKSQDNLKGNAIYTSHSLDTSPGNLSDFKTTSAVPVGGATVSEVAKNNAEVAKSNNSSSSKYIEAENSGTPGFEMKDEYFENNKNVLGFAVRHKSPVYITVETLNTKGNTSAVESLKLKLNNNAGKGYGDFIITGYSATYQERMSLLETFTSPFISFFGNKVPTYNFNIVFFHDDRHNQWNRFKALYDTYLRPSIAVDNNYKIRMLINGLILDGFIVSLQMQHSRVYTVEASMSFVVLSETYIPVKTPDNNTNLLSGNIRMLNPGESVV